jgi:hypothetical protein
MTKSEIIYTIKSLIKETDDSPGIYTEQFIWDQFIIAKSKRIEQKLNKKSRISDQFFTSVCLSLTAGVSHDCGCITIGCPVVKTVDIPKYIQSNYMSTLEVFTLGGKKMNRSTEEDFFSIDKYNEFKNDAYILVNDKIVIFNNPKLKVINVKAIWEDETKLDLIKYCTDTPSDCIDYEGKEINMNSSMFYDILGLMINILKIPLELPEDQSNDSSDNVKK